MRNHPSRRRNAVHYARHHQVDLDTSTSSFASIARGLQSAVRVPARSDVHGFTVFPGCLPLRTDGLPPLFKFLADLKWPLPSNPTNGIIGYFAIDPPADFVSFSPTQPPNLVFDLCGIHYGFLTVLRPVQFVTGCDAGCPKTKVRQRRPNATAFQIGLAQLALQLTRT
jgi:hypothetical protein